MLTYRDFRPSTRLYSTVSVSADGEIAFVDDSAGVFNISVMTHSGTRSIAADGELAVKRVAWVPGGGQLVFSADRGGNERHGLYLVDVATDVVTPLTWEPGSEHVLGTQPSSPDGRYLAYVANDRDRTVQDVIVRDLTTDKSRRIYTGSGLTRSGFWSPDGKYLAVSDLVEPFANHRLHVMAADGGPVRTLSGDERATYWMGPWKPDGSGFFVRTNRGREFTGLAFMDVQSGELSWIDTPEWDIEELAVSGDGSTLVWLVNVAGATEIRAHDMAAGADVTYGPIPTGVIDALAVSADATEMYLVMSTPSDPMNLGRVTADGFEWVTQFRPRHDVPPIKPELVSMASPSGDPIDAWLYRPADVTRPIGVVVSIHGGPTYQERPTYAYDGLYQYLLSRGVAVIAPNIHGSTGYGTTFSERIYRDWGGIDLDDLACVHAYLTELEWVDSTRIGLYGASYGGFMVLSAVTRLPELDWAAAVDKNGMSNLVTLALASPPTWRNHVRTIIGDPDSDHDFLIARSPLTYADQARTPMLIIQGANDPRVPMHESDQIVNALRGHGIDVVYEIVQDEGHRFGKADNDIRLQAMAAEFLLDHLL